MENKNKINKESMSEKQFYILKTVELKDKYNFYEYLSVMIDSGVGVLEALHSFNDKNKSPYFKEKLDELITFVGSGDSLSKSMKKLPDIFENSETSIIESGEATGGLVLSLAKLSEDLKKLHNLRNKVKSAFTYPIIIFLFLFLAILIVMIYVIPSIEPLFETSGVDLPFMTQTLISTSNFVREKFYILIFFAFSVFVLFAGFKATKTGKETIDDVKLSLPLVGTVYKNYILSNIASLLGRLVGSGVPIVKALTLIGRTTNNTIYEKLFSSISTKVASGGKIIDSMKKVDKAQEYFPNDFTQMLGVGEKTANIEEISKKINDQYTREVDHSLQNLTRWIEPLAILLAGIFVLWFSFAIFGALLKITETIS